MSTKYMYLVILAVPEAQFPWVHEDTVLPILDVSMFMQCFFAFCPFLRGMPEDGFLCLYKEFLLHKHKAYLDTKLIFSCSNAYCYENYKNSYMLQQ